MVFFFTVAVLDLMNECFLYTAFGYCIHSRVHRRVTAAKIEDFSRRTANPAIYLRREIKVP